MKFSDEQIRDMLELKEELTEKIIKYREQIEKLERNISVLDTILKQSSFTTASELTRNAAKAIKQERKVAITKNSDSLFRTSHSSNFFPQRNFAILVFRLTTETLEYFPILVPKSIPRRIIFLALK